MITDIISLWQSYGRASNPYRIFGATIAGPSSAFWIEVLIDESDSAKGLEIKNRVSSTYQEN